MCQTKLFFSWIKAQLNNEHLINNNYGLNVKKTFRQFKCHVKRTILNWDIFEGNPTKLEFFIFGEIEHNWGVEDFKTLMRRNKNRFKNQNPRSHFAFFETSGWYRFQFKCLLKLSCSLLFWVS